MNNNNEEVSKIINRIKKENIEPLPKWKANFSNYLYWIFLIVLILIGGIFSSFLIIDYFDIAPKIASHFNLGKFVFIMFRAAPVLWILLLVTALFFGVLAYRSTKKGYRHSITSIIILMVVAISLVGFVNHISKFDRHMEDFLENRMPPRFDRFVPHRERRFMNPEEGIIAGRITELNDEGLILRNKKQEWRVNFLPDIEIKGRNSIEVGTKVLIMGESRGDNTFYAKVIITDPPQKPIRR